MAQTLGIVDLIWLGTKIPIKTATYKRGGLVNNAMVASRRVFNSQEFQADTVEATVPFKAGDSLAQFAASQIGELQYVCDTGQTYTIPDAFVTGTPQITPGSGKEGGTAKIAWAGSPAQEVIS